MKRIKKSKGICFALLALIMVALVVPHDAFAKGDNSENLSVYLEMVDIFDAKQFYEIFTKEGIKNIEATGRQIIDKGDTVVVYSKTKPQPKKIGDVNLYINGEKAPVNLDGTISIPKNLERSTDPIISIDDENILCAGPTLMRSKEKEIIFRISGEYVLEMMQQKEEYVKKEILQKNEARAQKGYGDKYYPGDWVHCNRFNGPNTDSVHYNKKTHLELALKNFYGSDCDTSVRNFGPCVSFMHKFCNQEAEAAACSRLTKYANGRLCPTEFHLHHEPAEWK